MTPLVIFLSLVASYFLGLATGLLVHRRPFTQMRDEHGRFLHR